MYSISDGIQCRMMGEAPLDTGASKWAVTLNGASTVLNECDLNSDVLNRSCL